MANETKPFSIIPSVFGTVNVPELSERPMAAFDIGELRKGAAYVFSRRNAVWSNPLNAAILLRTFTNSGRYLEAYQKAMATENDAAIRAVTDQLFSVLIEKMGGERRIIGCDNGRPTTVIWQPSFMAAANSPDSLEAVWSDDDGDDDLEGLIASAVAGTDG